MSDKQTWCGNCGAEGVTLTQCNNMHGTYLLCAGCAQKREESIALAQQIIDGTAPPTTPDFGFHCDEAVRLACAMFPDTFRLRNHAGVFRVSPRASYVSRGRVMLYTQRLDVRQELTPFHGGTISKEEWVDFAKGTIQELKAQVMR